MRSIQAVKEFHEMYGKGIYLYTLNDVGLVLGERGATLKSTVRRLVADGVLEHVARNTYKYAFTKRADRIVIYDLAAFMRRGRWAYESLESAAAQWGIIDQIPIGRVMVVTTGASGTVKTPYGVIEYNHTEESGFDFYKELADREPETMLPIASKDRTLHDLLVRRRSLDLIDWEMVEDED